MHGDSPVVAFRVGFGFTISLLSLFLIPLYQIPVHTTILAVMRFSFFPSSRFFIYELSISVLIILNALAVATLIYIIFYDKRRINHATYN